MALGLGGSFLPITVPAQDTDNQLRPPSIGQDNNAEMWRAIRQGIQGKVSIPDKKAGVLVQSEGEEWRSIRNGPVSNYGVWLILGTIAVLALFFTARGRIRIENGRTGRTILRFASFERFIHWTVAVSFILLALTGLNLLYGRYVVKPWMGADTFAMVTLAGKFVHNYIGLLFILGLTIMFLIWIRQNVPTRIDLIWLAKGGGMFKRGVHPPARKFNAGQKIVFAAVIIGGALLSYSGLNLMFPFTLETTVQDMQQTQLLHAIGALALTAVIIAHIYIGTIGMEGAIDAMWSGRVEENWAREHHNLWFKELDTQTETQETTNDPNARGTPAE
ncbi:MAG TPA: formate dehydrogenase subunit gamma [Alphaproteobacteria bacterium]|nr:formate dehydrogenase subunit gamma [Alphaproteobacteria bacterium]HIA21598.1 formate dehydrogenase subunit gamma [Alphaproteobacteria bacterium]HIB19924.1 formate dehydrogenase subunit gamma [Alphaproteobacteria bacterium]HIN93668.1 formate dehydrogenase subunit gamma [Alphaproteobacteria bacterium]